MTPPQLVDRHALARNRRRARPDALFLHDEAVIEVQERLAAVNRQFTKPAIVTPFAEIWAGAFPDAKIIPDAEVLDLADSAHDLVIHAMALHWANDPVGQMVQCRRALCPDGLFIGLTLGGRRWPPCVPRWPRPRQRKLAGCRRECCRWAKSAIWARCCNAPG